MSRAAAAPFHRRLRAVVCAAALIAAPATAQETPAAAPAGAPAVDAAVTAFIAKLKAPAVSVAVVDDGRIVLNRAWGTADLENAVPARPESVFRIASVSKPITAVAVMQLVEQGKIDLDAPITRYVPGYAHPVPVRDLLRHTGGVRHYKNNAEFASTRRCETLAEGMEVFAKDPLEHPTGQGVTYSTYGFVLLGLAVEQASGLSFPEYVRKNIFEPAGMTRTRVDDLHAVIPGRVEGYARTEAGEIRHADLVDTSCRIPAGGFVSTAEDLAKFAAAVMDDRLLKPATREQMMRSQVSEATVAAALAKLKAAGVEVPAGYKFPGLGFGWAVGTQSTPEAVNHGGNQQGATSMLYLLPEERRAVVVLTNLGAQGQAVTELAEQIAAATKAEK